jgi:hypothetical protein
MEDPKTQKLIDEVIAKTRAGRIRWEATATADEYFSVLPSGHTIIVGIEHDYNSSNPWFVLRNADDQQLLRVTPDVEAVREVVLSDLHELARRSALKVDATVDKVLGELARL